MKSELSDLEKELLNAWEGMKKRKARNQSKSEEIN